MQASIRWEWLRRRTATGIIHIENIDDPLLAYLRGRADANGSSMEDEVLGLLRRELSLSDIGTDRWAEADRIRALTKGDAPETDSVAVIRELRHTRHAGG